MKFKKKSRIITMPTLRRRCKKMMRKRHKKTIQLKTLDRVWNSYAEWAIKHLLKYGKVNLGNHTVMEIVGKPVISDNTALKAFSSGKYINADGSVKTANLSSTDIKYEVRITNPNYKGQIIFDTDPKFRKRVSEHLKKTKQYYRIEK